MKSETLSLSLIAAAILTLGSPARASSTTTDSGTDASTGPQLEEVVVSAQRITENVNKVPVSLSAFSQQQLDDQHIENLADLASVVPGLILPPAGSGGQGESQIVIRGVVSGGNAPTTGVYIDETPIDIRQLQGIGFSGTPQPDLFDLQRIEVLRGPQGTLFGSGAMGGAIRYIMNQPNLDAPSGYAKAETGFTHQGAPSYSMGFAYGAPIVQGTAGFRISGYYHSDGGYITLQDPFTGDTLKRNANSGDGYAFRPAFTWMPTEGLSITPAFFYQHQHTEEPAEVWINPAYPGPGAFISGFGGYTPQPFTDDLRLPSLTIKYQMPGMTFQSDTSYLDQSQMSVDDYASFLAGAFTGAPFQPALKDFRAYDLNLEKSTSWVQQFRLSSDNEADSRWGWVAGAYFRRSEDNLTQYVSDLNELTEFAFNSPAEDIFGTAPYVQNGVYYTVYGVAKVVTQEKALFGNVSWNILAKLKATVGLRLSESSLPEQKYITTSTLPAPINALTVSQIPSKTEHPVTPRYTLTYQYTDDGMIYATAAKGFRAGGSNLPIVTDNPQCNISANALGFSSVPVNFNSDSVWSYELGTKGEFLDHRLSAQASIYYIDWTNIQSAVDVTSCSNQFTTNLGVATSQGFDLQLQGLLAEGLKLGANVSYDRAYYRKSIYGQPATAGGQPPLVTSAGEAIQGNSYVPWMVSSVLDYSRDASWLWESARLYTRLDYRWRDRAPGEQFGVSSYIKNLAGRSDPAYSTVNLRFGLLRNGVDVSAFVNNLTNAKPYFSQNNPIYPIYIGTTIRPLTAGLTALYHF